MSSGRFVQHRARVAKHEKTHAIDEAIRNSEKVHGPTHPRTKRLKLYAFFRTALNNSLITSLNFRARSALDPIVHQIVESVRAEMGNDSFRESHFNNFCVQNPKMCRIGLAYVPFLLNAIPRTERVRTTELRELWRQIVENERNYIPHLNRRIHRADRPILTADKCTILGDYLLFRLDAPGLVRVAFFRFYEHYSGGVRSLGLRLDDEHNGLSSKGWVSQQQNGYLVAGYIVDRRPARPGTAGLVSPKPAGGFSMLQLSLDSSNAYYIEDRGGVLMCPALHAQSLFASGMNCSRGILIRLIGAEKLGVVESGDRQKWHQKILDMQRKLSKFFKDYEKFEHSSLSLRDACRFLAETIGTDPSFFSGNESHPGAFSTNYDAGFGLAEMHPPLIIAQRKERISLIDAGFELGVRYFGEDSTQVG